jgi:hypothetical protein
MTMLEMVKAHAADAVQMVGQKRLVAGANKNT